MVSPQKMQANPIAGARSAETLTFDFDMEVRLMPRCLTCAA